MEAFRTVSNLDLRETFINLHAAGWNVNKTNGGHFKLTHPEAAKVVFAASTPSCNRAHLKVLADCKRALLGRLNFKDDVDMENLTEEDFLTALKNSKMVKRTKKRRERSYTPKQIKPGFSAPTPASSTIALQTSPDFKNQAEINITVDSVEFDAVVEEVVLVERDNDDMDDAGKVIEIFEPDVGSAPRIQEVMFMEQNAEGNSVPLKPKWRRARSKDLAKQTAPIYQSQTKDLTQMPKNPVLTSIGRIPQNVFDLAMKIALGHAMKIEITADMVGKTLICEGNLSLVEMDHKPEISVEMPSKHAVLTDTSPVASSDMAPSNPSANEILQKKILDIIQIYGGTITGRDLASLMMDELPYKNLDSARASLYRPLCVLEKDKKIKRVSVPVVGAKTKTISGYTLAA